MKKQHLTLSIFLFLLATCTWFCQNTPSTETIDKSLEKKFTNADYTKGKALIAEMQAAYGGKERWQSYTVGRFHQVADWYGNIALSGWDTIPQHFAMVSKLGTDNCELFLVNGKNKRQHWGIEDEKTYILDANAERIYKKNKTHAHKLSTQNFWFQFPFRIDEAEGLAYAGTEELKGKSYDLVYASWGSKKSNLDFDQFLLYINPKTHLIEHLHFIVKEEMKPIEMTARFDDFKAVRDLVLPHSQYVRAGKPQQDGAKVHENHYVSILMGVE